MINGRVIEPKPNVPCIFYTAKNKIRLNKTFVEVVQSANIKVRLPQKIILKINGYTPCMDLLNLNRK